MASTIAPYSTPLTRIKLQPAQHQSLTINLNGTDYRLRLLFNEGDPFSAGVDGTWYLDIGDADGVPLVCGIPLLPGQNLLDPYSYLEIGGGGALFCYGAGAREGEIPGWDTLGTTWQLYFAPFTYRVPNLSGVATIPQALAEALLAADGGGGAAG